MKTLRVLGGGVVARRPTAWTVYCVQTPSPLLSELMSKLPSKRMHQVVEPPSIVEAGALKDRPLHVIRPELRIQRRRRLAIPSGVARCRRLAAEQRLPTMYGLREAPLAGGFMSYGPNFSDLFRRAGGYVDKILRGARPQNLPVEQASRFELVINLKTATALGLTIPPSLLLRADQVIE